MLRAFRVARPSWSLPDGLDRAGLPLIGFAAGSHEPTRRKRLTLR